MAVVSVVVSVVVSAVLRGRQEWRAESVAPIRKLHTKADRANSLADEMLTALVRGKRLALLLISDENAHVANRLRLKTKKG